MTMEIPTEIKDLVRSSGNSFHSRVARWLSDNGWHVIISPYYLDQSQGKAREIDIVAERSLADSTTNSRKRREVVVRLYVECKYANASSVFWMANKDLQKAGDILHSAGIFTAEWLKTQYHHYMENSLVAKVFASSRNKQTESDPFYKALNQVLNAMVALRDRPVTIPGLARKMQNGLEVRVMEFPVVVCNSFDRVYAAGFYEDKAIERMNDRFQLEVSYAYTDRKASAKEEYFLIDIVELDKMSEFVGVLEQDATSAAKIIGWPG